MKLRIDKEFSERVPHYRTVIMEAEVKNSPTSVSQKEEMDCLAAEIAGKYKVEDINRIPAIAATRAAYKACGKDPNRYRPSQEQLHRRIVRGLGLYNVNSLVDAGNELSLLTGCSVGCFDAEKVDGDTIVLGVGHENEPYEGIGRGPLNIEGLPVFRDNTGGIGTPTSDNERTKLELTTRRLLVTIHLFDPAIDADKTVRLAEELFTRHGNARGISATIYTLDNSTITGREVL